MRCERKKVLSIIPILSCAERHFKQRDGDAVKGYGF